MQQLPLQHNYVIPLVRISRLYTVCVLLQPYTSKIVHHFYLNSYIFTLKEEQMQASHYQ